MAIDLDLWKLKRKELKLDYQTLSKKADVSLNTIKNIFRGATTDPRVETVQRIEKALGITPQEPIQEYTEEEKQLLSLITQMTDEEVEELSNFVDYIISKRKKV
jgi:transcriptional regulator with XRE-family HTH domain